MNYLHNGEFDGFLTCVYCHYYESPATGIYEQKSYEPVLFEEIKFIETDQCKLGLCVKSDTVATSLGAGVSMYFDLKNGISCLLFILTVFMAAPCVGMGWYVSRDHPTVTVISAAVEIPDNLINDTEIITSFDRTGGNDDNNTL